MGISIDEIWSIVDFGIIAYLVIVGLFVVITIVGLVYIFLIKMVDFREEVVEKVLLKNEKVLGKNLEWDKWQDEFEKSGEEVDERSEECPECGGALDEKCWSGVKCTVCDYWFCY